MSENEFLIWLKGFRDCVGEGRAPTEAQWADMNAKLDETLAQRVKDLMLEKQTRQHPLWYPATVTTTTGATTGTTTVASSPMWYTNVTNTT